MQARKFKAVVHIGASEVAIDQPDDVWISIINEAIARHGGIFRGVRLELQPKEWEPPGGLARNPRPFRRSRVRR